ncbi:hypothetical protein B0H12DRAFT_224757 [Mycena haematopus]|nr:hypothetical protein B0H12DRAFT_224757 [Mycena haematopus]
MRCDSTSTGRLRRVQHIDRADAPSSRYAIPFSFSVCRPTACSGRRACSGTHANARRHPRSMLLDETPRPRGRRRSHPAWRGEKDPSRDLYSGLPQSFFHPVVLTVEQEQDKVIDTKVM